MNLLLESMTPLEVAGFKIRVWREEDPRAGGFSTEDLIETAEELQSIGSVLDAMMIANRLIAMPRVNAVEVLNASRHGIVLYRDWP